MWYTARYMIAKKPTKKQKASLDTVLSTVERGFAAVAEDIADIKGKMATKDDVRVIVRDELKPIRSTPPNHVSHDDQNGTPNIPRRFLLETT